MGTTQKREKEVRTVDHNPTAQDLERWKDKAAMDVEEVVAVGFGSNGAIPRAGRI